MVAILELASTNLPAYIFQGRSEVISETEFENLKEITSNVQESADDDVTEQTTVCVYCHKNCDENFLCSICSLFSHGWCCKVIDEGVIYCHLFFMN